MRGEPDQHVWADQLARLCHGHVVLADVHAVGCGRARDERAVVDDQQRAERLAHGARRARQLGQLVVAEALVAQLHDVHAAGDRAAEQALQLAQARRRGVEARGAHQIQTRAGQARTPALAEIVARLLIAAGHRSESGRRAEARSAVGRRLASRTCPRARAPPT